jgi:hypothetical protein
VQDTSYSVPGSVKVTVTFEGAFRWSFSPWPPPTPDNPPVGTIIFDEVFLDSTGANFHDNQSVGLLVTSVSSAEDRLTGIGSIDLIIPDSALPVTASVSGCCRISTLAEGNNDLGYFLTTVIDPSKATRSPVTTALTRVYLQKSTFATFQLPSVAFDGLTNFFSVAPSSSSFLTTPRPD